MKTNSAAPVPATAVILHSSSIAEAAYDSARSLLQLRFRDGTLYQYIGVPPSAYHALLEADSKGRHFNQYIRNRYRHVRLFG